VLRDFFLGFIKIHILHHAAQEPVYGAWMMEELAHQGYNLSPGTLYPILHALEANGLLSREEQVVAGKVRKYYSATDEGQKALQEVRIKMRELVGEVLEDEGSSDQSAET
jgi:PadR family transcriptional regulator PadR